MNNHANEGRVILLSSLSAVLIKSSGRRRDFGIVSRKMVTDAGVAFLCDAFQGLATLSNMKYHGSGTGTNIEAVTDVALQIEVESRATGSQTETANNIYSTVGLCSYASGHAITEHGIFSASTSGTLWDRSVFSVITVIAGDSIQFTYNLTLTAGG